jgi:hypothetical protein
MPKEEKLISKKKAIYPISKPLERYLVEHHRYFNLPVLYEDLLRFNGGIEVLDEEENDTLWIRVYYSDFERDEIDRALKQIYSYLHADGTDALLPFINIDAIDYCTFGNTKPFRIKVRNIINDNYVYFYVKKADASRVYGLELENLLSPNKINFLVYKSTLIEEHISGIPGDVFVEQYLPMLSLQQKRALAKEFVKFNEFCFIRLLGDMRSYNYVIVLTHDFDRMQFRIRAIDFDQQSYEGNVQFYILDNLKENKPLVKMTKEVLKSDSIEQYKIEERSLLARRAEVTRSRTNQLLQCMMQDRVSTDEKTDQLRKGLFKLTKDLKFKKSESMGELLDSAMDFILRNYKNKNPFLGNFQ